MNKLVIKKTKSEDLENVMSLWNDGEVMKYVGFPNGIGVTVERLEKWLIQMDQNENANHFSIYHEDLGYCGETFYSIDAEHGLGMLDIKLFPKARGKGIARFSLEYSIDEAFKSSLCNRVYVDPDPENKKAWALYEKIGFKSKERPSFLEPSEVYLECTEEDYKK